MRMKISEIKINPGRRDTQPRNVEELARSIAAVGLMNPITVTQDNTLIAGLHRLEAVKLLGWTKIECVVSEADGLQAELAEIDENFVRAGLSHRELDDLLLRRKELYEALHPETRQGQRNGQTAKNDNLTLLAAKPFSEDTADKLGISKRTVERLVQTAANLTPEAKKTIRDAGDKITKGAALKISKLPPDQQGRRYLEFFNKTVAELIDRTPSTVAQSLCELEVVGLVKKKLMARNAPYRIYVMLPAGEVVS